MYIPGENNPRKDSVREKDDWSSGFCSLVFSCPLSPQCTINCCTITVMKPASGLFRVRNSGTVRRAQQGFLSTEAETAQPEQHSPFRHSAFRNTKVRVLPELCFFPLWILGRMLYVPVLSQSSLQSMQRLLVTLISSGLNLKADQNSHQTVNMVVFCLHCRYNIWLQGRDAWNCFLYALCASFRCPVVLLDCC